MKSERAAAAAARPDAAQHAAARFMAALPVDNTTTIALYAPLKDELDTWPLAEALAEKGARLALPAVVKKNAPLAFRRVSLTTALVKGRFGVLEPPEDADDVTPRIILCPLLAFSRDGARLGYGGGFYDRTLAQLRERGDGAVLAVGYGYGAQELAKIPVDARDAPLDWVVTEREAIRIR